MAQVSGSPFKFIYTNWLTLENKSVPIANGIYPIGLKKLYEVAKDPGILQFINQVPYENMVLEKNPELYLFYVLGHSLLIHYLDCYYPRSCFINEDDIIDDDDSVYLYIIETNRGNFPLYNTFTVNIEGNQQSFCLKDLFTNKIIKYLKTNKVRLVLNNIQDPCPANHEVSNILNYLHDLGISKDNVIFITGNKQKNSETNIVTGMLALFEGNKVIDTYPRLTHLGYVSDIVRENDLNATIFRPKKFICFNRNIERYHRIYLAYLALKHKLFDVGYFSFLNIENTQQIDTFLYQMQKERRIIHPLENTSFFANTIKKMLPIQLDTHHLSENERWGFGTVDNYKKEYYINSYVHIVSETNMKDHNFTPFYSEKTIRPMMNLQPFVYFGDYLALKKLKDLGFKTFHPFIDESYDNEPDPFKRMKMSGQEVVKLNNMPIEQLHDWYYSITDILKHNQQHLRTFKHYDVFGGAMQEITEIYKNGIKK